MDIKKSAIIGFKLGIILIVVVTNFSCKKSINKKGQTFNENEVVTRSEIYKWSNNLMNELSTQHPIYFDSAQQTILNGKYYLRVPVGGTNGYFYFTKDDNGILQVTFIRTWLISGQQKYNGQIEFADFTNKRYYIASYHNEKSDSVFVLKTPNLYFDKIFRSSIHSLPVGINSTHKELMAQYVYSDPLSCPSPNPSDPSSLWDWLGNLFGGIGNFFSNLFSIDSNVAGGMSYMGVSLTWFIDNTGTTNYNTGTVSAPIWTPVSSSYAAPGQSYYDSNHPFNGLDNPIKTNDDPIIQNGVLVDDITTPPIGNPRKIAETTSRGNTEDMLQETVGDVTGLRSDMIGQTDDYLFSQMTSLFHAACIFSFYSGPDLTPVGDLFIQKFRSTTGGQYSNDTLNKRVSQSSVLINFLKRFGIMLNNQLQINGNNITNVSTITIDNKYRPIFNGPANKTNGLMILINDTEYSEIQLDQFTMNSDGTWSADVTVVIHDHFGLDKNDVLSYQYVTYGSGFAGWWLLQHTRNYAPFETIVTVHKSIYVNAVP